MPQFPVTLLATQAAVFALALELVGSPIRALDSNHQPAQDASAQANKILHVGVGAGLASKFRVLPH
jgi:hypothetical protein